MTYTNYDPVFAEYPGGRIRLLFIPDTRDEEPAAFYSSLQKTVDAVCRSGKRKLLRRVEGLIYDNKHCELSVIIADKWALQGTASLSTWARRYRLCDAIGRAFSDALLADDGGHNYLHVISGDASFIADLRWAAEAPDDEDTEFLWCEGEDPRVHARRCERDYRESRAEAEYLEEEDLTEDDFYPAETWAE